MNVYFEENVLNFFPVELHCVKSVRIRSFSGRHFPTFGLNTERYEVSIVLSPNARKYEPEKLQIWTLSRSVTWRWTTSLSADHNRVLATVLCWVKISFVCNSKNDIIFTTPMGQLFREKIVNLHLPSEGVYDLVVVFHLQLL